MDDDERDVMAKWEHYKATLTVPEMNELLHRGELTIPKQLLEAMTREKVSKEIPRSRCCGSTNVITKYMDIDTSTINTILKSEPIDSLPKIIHANEYFVVQNPNKSNEKKRKRYENPR